MDDDLRSTIDRLIANGGRLTARGATGASVVLAQPGSRFGIAEVHGRLTIDPSSPTADDAEAGPQLPPVGWFDPTVTLRLGREVRISRSEATVDGPRIFERVWRVPPTLGSDIASDVRTVVPDIAAVDFEPLPTRETRRTTTAGGPADRPPVPVADISPYEDGQPQPERRPRKALPAPLRAMLGLALVSVVAVVWAGMIRGAPRQSGAVASPDLAGVLAGASATLAPTPSPTPTASPTPTPDPTPTAYPTHVLKSSSYRPGSPAAAALDGDPATAWHPRPGLPQWIEIGLDRPVRVTQIELVIAQLPPTTRTRHMVQVAKVGGPLEVVGIIDGETNDRDFIVFRPDSPIDDVERIRIETLEAPNGAGWYEVAVR